MQKTRHGRRMKPCYSDARNSCLAYSVQFQRAFGCSRFLLLARWKEKYLHAILPLVVNMIEWLSHRGLLGWWDNHQQNFGLLFVALLFSTPLPKYRYGNVGLQVADHIGQAVQGRLGLVCIIRVATGVTALVHWWMSPQQELKKILARKSQLPGTLRSG